MDRWREYLESAGVDFWTICERALALAYLDKPHDFPSQRDRLAQKLYAPEKLVLEVSEEQAPKATIQPNRQEHKGVDASHRSDGSSGGDEDNEDDDPRNHTPTSGNYDEAEALTEEMEEENLMKRDVFEIKDTLLDSYKSEREIFDSLQRLELMQLSFDVLKETEIGKAANSLRKHSSGRIRTLVKKLVSEWKDTVEHWYKSVEDVTAAASAGPVASDSPLDEEEDGLPSPPMDEGALLAGRTASLEMSQLFDFMDDETCTGNRKSRSDVSHSVSLKNSNGHIDGMHDLQPMNKHGEHQDSSGRKKIDSDVRKNDRDSVRSSNRHSNRDKDDQTTNGASSRRVSYEKVERNVQRQETFKKEVASGGSHKTETSKPANDSPELDQKLLAASRRRLQENYQQIENAKRQRTIQVMELEDLPKGGPKRAKAPQVARGKPFSQHRPQAFGRR